jgi:hypothetical protein
VTYEPDGEDVPTLELAANQEALIQIGIQLTLGQVVRSIELNVQYSTAEHTVTKYNENASTT